MKLFSWGANSYGQLGQGNTSEQCNIPVEITDIVKSYISNISCITGGGGHTMLLTFGGLLFSCGWNHKGQLGLGTFEDVHVFQPVSALQGLHVVQVACGWDFTLAVTNQGHLYSWGSNSFGQLGLSDTKMKQSCIPMRISLGGVVQVSAGLRHAVALTEDGCIYVWGSGKKGQLGVTSAPGVIPVDLQEPVRVPEVSNIKEVSCGQHHTFALSRNGELFVFGDNKHGQLALDPARYPCSGVPQKIPRVMSTWKNNLALDAAEEMCVSSCQEPSEAENWILHLESGWTHGAAVTAEEEVLTWGRCSYGQLGHCGRGLPSWKPQKVDGLTAVKQLCSGSEHNLVLIDGGHVFSWGWNEHGNCGTGNEENVFTPVKVGFGTSGKVIRIGSGSGHCFALQEDEG